MHLGSGSGSLWSGVITDDPANPSVLAVGHEPCWPNVHELPPEQAWPRDQADDSPERWAAPDEFRAWVTSTFDVTIPDTARAVVPPLDDADGNRRHPFGRWLDLGRRHQAAARATLVSLTGPGVAPAGTKVCTGRDQCRCPRRPGP